MTTVECPICKKKVDLDVKTVETESYGTDLKVKCPHCITQFMVARIAHVRAKLAVAEFGYKQEGGRQVKIRL